MNGKSSAELEREAEVARANVTETADALRSKLTPGQMIDEFTGMFAGGDGETALNNLKAQVRDNPLPLTLVGAGLAWLMLGSGTSARGTSEQFEEIPRPRSMDREFGSSDDQSTGGLVDTVGQRTSEISSKAGAYMDTARETIGSAGRRAREATNSLSRQAGDIATKSKTATLDMIDKEPLLLAAFGVAVGTAIGVLLPRTDLEDDQLGPVSKNIRAKAEELMDEGVGQAKDLAAEAYQTLKEEADQQGLRSDGSVVDKVSDVVRSTAQKTEDAVRDKLKT
jgi:ElaB/YqjD/DUF883 family membrane-anchored ribosome-binding protein